MSNMSYCKFQNTMEDLEDCYDAMDIVPKDPEERKARLQIIRLCKEIAKDYGDEVKGKSGREL